MANSIEFAEKYQKFIDEELESRSFTQWMVPNADMISYDGGKDVKIAQLSVSGLGNYDPNAAGAYPKGSVKLTWKPYTMEMDRAVQFQLGRMTPSDSGWIATTENITKTFARKQLVTEQDLFRFNRVYSSLKASGKWASHSKTLTADLTAADAVSTLMGLFTLCKEDSNEDQDFICFMAAKSEAAFREASKNNHHDIQFGKTVSINGVGYKCMMVNELPVVLVPSRRLQTVIKVNDGRTAGQEQGGIEADTTSKQIEFMMMSSEAAIAIGKVDSLKIVTADLQQTSDETTINYHLLYDCWSLENQLSTVAVATR